MTIILCHLMRAEMNGQKMQSKRNNTMRRSTGGKQGMQLQEWLITGVVKGGMMASGAGFPWHLPSAFRRGRPEVRRNSMSVQEE